VSFDAYLYLKRERSL